MSPPIETFPASELARRIHVTPQGRRRKGDDVVLNDCELLEMVQYACHLEEDPKKPRTALVKCEPIVRLFRRWVKMLGNRESFHPTVSNLVLSCADNYLVETTPLEGMER